jgi:hypothetical protein
MVSLDRARRVVLGTSMERLEHVPRRIRGGITRIRCQLHLREFSILPTIYETIRGLVHDHQNRFVFLMDEANSPILIMKLYDEHPTTVRYFILFIQLNATIINVISTSEHCPHISSLLSICKSML